MWLPVVVRFALAIVLDALAFVTWDVGTRPPLRLLHDMARGARIPRTLAGGTIRFAVGLLLLVLAAAIARPGIPTARAFTLIETGMLIAALLVEQLVGPDLRRTVRSRPARAATDSRNATAASPEARNATAASPEARNATAASPEARNATAASPEGRNATDSAEG